MEDLKEKLNRLDLELGKIIVLVIPEEKLPIASDLITKYTKEFHERILPYYNMIDSIRTEEINKAFNPFVNNILSIVEILNVPGGKFKPVRKLCLNEIYKMRNEILILDTNKK